MRHVTSVLLPYYYFSAAFLLHYFTTTLLQQVMPVVQTCYVLGEDLTDIITAADCMQRAFKAQRVRARGREGGRGGGGGGGRERVLRL